MIKNFYKLEREFLSYVGIDYVPLIAICHDVMRKQTTPTKEAFQITLEFITYLRQKYGNHFHYTFGAGETPIDKNFEEFIQWLQQEYDQGNYKSELEYGVWFHLDGQVIPKSYWPEDERLLPDYLYEYIQNNKDND